MKLNKTNKIIAGFLLVVTLFFLSNGIFVKAGTANFYPNVCLGGWQNSSKVQGTPDLSFYSSPDEFNEDNSAVLGSLVGSQIFCGNFTGDTYNGINIKEVKLNLIWSFKNSNPEIINEKSLNDIEKVIEEEFAPTSWIPNFVLKKALAQEVVEEPPVQEPVVQEPPVQEPVVQEPPVQEPIIQEPVIEEPPVQEPPVEEPPVEEPVVEEPVVEEDPVQETTPEPEVIEEPEISEPKIIQPEAPQEVIPQEIIPQEEYFVIVSYTVDGKNWQEIGKIGFSNWQNASFSLPINSWESLSNVQISIQNSLFLGDKPAIYLDGMSLDIQYEDTIATILVDATSDVLEAAIEAVTDTSDGLLSFVKDIFTSDDNQEITQPDIAQNENEPKTIKFSLQAQANPVKIPNLQEDLFKEKNSIELGEISFANGQNDEEIKLSGKCLSEYFNVLLFSNVDGYAQDPTRAIINKSFPCVDKLFQYQFKSEDIPKTIVSGTYYLMIGSQKETGPWIPATPIYPIIITQK
ncbi:MAG: hypothetical protein WC705_00630 [Candidatus Paceibacterota bacterium]|jgi:hypothetical protein